jgi:gluconolactonase
MAIDCAGDLYIAATNSTNVMVVSPTGTLIGMISLPSAFQAVTNVAFGGADHKTLYITGYGNNNKGLFQVPMSLPGLPY